MTPTTVNYTAAPTLAFNSTAITGDATLDGSNVIFSLGALSIGSNTLTTQGTNNVTAGATTLSGDASFNNDNGLTLGALGDGGPARTITKNGTGTLTLGTAATLLTAGTAINVNNGVLVANVTGALSQTATTANTTTVTVNNGGELRGMVVGSFKSTGTVTPSEAINLADGTVRLSNAATTDFGGNLTYASGSLILDRTAGGGTLTQTMNSLSIGSASLTPLQANYTSAPTLAFTSTTITGDATLDASDVMFSLGVLGIGANTLTTQGGRAFTAGVTTLTGAATFSIGATSPLTVAAITGTGNSLTLQGAGDFAQTGVFDGIGSSLVLDGNYTGTATLSGVNTYTGDTTINGGILAVGSDTALGATGVGGATLKFTGGTLKTTAAITSNRPVIVDTGDGIINTNGFDLTLGGTFSGTGSLNKNGAGTLTISGISTNTAAIHVTGGALVGNTNSLKGDVTLSNDTNVTFDQSNDGTYANVVRSEEHTSELQSLV